MRPGNSRCPVCKSGQYWSKKYILPHMQGVPFFSLLLLLPFPPSSSPFSACDAPSWLIVRLRGCDPFPLSIGVDSCPDFLRSDELFAVVSGCSDARFGVDAPFSPSRLTFASFTATKDDEGALIAENPPVLTAVNPDVVGWGGGGSSAGVADFSGVSSVTDAFKAAEA